MNLINSTEEDTYRILSRLPMGDELCDLVFVENGPIIGMESKDYLILARAIHKQGWDVFEFYQELDLFNIRKNSGWDKSGFTDPNTSSKDIKVFMRNLILAEKTLKNSYNLVLPYGRK